MNIFFYDEQPIRLGLWNGAYFEDTCDTCMRLHPSRKYERDYFSYLHRTFYEAMMACAEKKGSTPEENEFLNREFWKLSERANYYKNKSLK